ncbi:hypothetical protein ACIOJD_09750 [Streptomyces sp. NPDC088116]|uniref:hypothetical protein n=1 Tax=Streptomyces sp. NPDC088116 TaxID=3365825 RepID=UPI00382EC51D
MRQLRIKVKGVAVFAALAVAGTGVVAATSASSATGARASAGVERTVAEAKAPAAARYTVAVKNNASAANIRTSTVEDSRNNLWGTVLRGTKFYVGCWIPKGDDGQDWFRLYYNDVEVRYVLSEWVNEGSQKIPKC